ncbi:MAG: hypothetical protein AAFX08_03375 [Pseudomonadota bacterium]
MEKPPLTDEELDRLVRATLKDGVGRLRPDEMPHRLRERLKAHASGADDLDKLVARALSLRAANENER